MMLNVSKKSKRKKGGNSQNPGRKKVFHQDYESTGPLSWERNFKVAGSFSTVSRDDILAENLDTRSDTSSMEANISTAPDINSDDEDLEISSTAYSEQHLQELSPSEKLQFLGVGEWSTTLIPSLYPWRMDAVNFEDLAKDSELSLHASNFKQTAFQLEERELEERGQKITSFIIPQMSGWKGEYVPGFTAEPSESMPSMTEDYTLDTDSVGLEDRIDSQARHPAYPSTVHERKIPMSPRSKAAFLSGMQWGPLDDLTMMYPSRLEKYLDGPKLVLRPEVTDTHEEAVALDHPLPSALKSIDTGLMLLEDDESVYSTEESMESAWISDYFEETPTLEDDHPFLQIKLDIVLDALMKFQSCQQRPGENSTTSGNVPDVQASGTSSGGKRSRSSGDGSEETTEGGISQDVQGKRRRTSKKSSEHQVAFACPFAKKDPLKYRSCYAYVNKRIRDVKQHLSRFHQLPIYCPRCKLTFDAENERDEHILDWSCSLVDAESYEGVTRAQKDQLSQRVPSKLSGEKQWYTVFEILFPGYKPRPASPYVNWELTLDLEGFQTLMYTEGPTIISAAIQSSGIQVSAITNEERDLSALLNSAIEEGLQAIVLRWSTSTANYQENTTGAVEDVAGSGHEIHRDDLQPSPDSSNTLINLRSEPQVETSHRQGERTGPVQEAENREAEFSLAVLLSRDDVRNIERSSTTSQPIVPVNSMSDLELGYFEEGLYGVGAYNHEEFWKPAGEDGLFQSENPGHENVLDLTLVNSHTEASSKQ